MLVLVWLIAVSWGEEHENTNITGLPSPIKHFAWVCDTLIFNYNSYAPTGETPPKKLSHGLQNEFTLGGLIPFEEYYVDDTAKGKGTHYTYNKEVVASYIDSFDPAKLNFRKLTATQLWLWLALEAYPVKGKHVLVFGSTTPYHEGLLLSLGAKHVTTVEYNKLSYDHPDITTTTPQNLVIPEGGFDYALSISSFDHDGLGRYGDPIDPFGDIKAMRLANCLLKENALLLLTVPVGPDVLAFNLHRRYGRVRLPHLLDGWETVHIEGWNPSSLDAQVNYRQSYEPVFVLKKTQAAQVPLPDHDDL